MQGKCTAHAKYLVYLTQCHSPVVMSSYFLMHYNLGSPSLQGQSLMIYHGDKVPIVPINSVFLLSAIPIGSVSGLFTYIYHKNQPNVSKYTMHGSYGICQYELILFILKQLPTIDSITCIQLAPV